MQHLNSKAILCLAALIGTQQLAPAQTSTARQPTPATQKTTQFQAQIDEMLEKCGLNRETRQDDLGSNYSEVKVEKDGWKYSIAVQASPSGQKVWLTITLKKFGPNEEVSQDRLLELMDSSRQIGRGQFLYDKNPRALKYTTHFDRRGLTAEDVRGEVNDFVSDLHNNRSAWNLPVQAVRQP